MHDRNGLEGPAEEVRLVGGRATRLASAGQGAPLLWLHDSLGNRWSPGHARLADSCRVLAPSLPGFEDGEALAGIDQPEDVVFWLLDLLDELQLSRPAVLGCGLGGWMAAELAVRYPERLGALVLVDAYGLRVADALPEDEFALPTPRLREVVFAEPEGGVAQAWLPDAEPPERLERALLARVASARLAWQFPYSPKLRGRLGRARVPSLVLWGERDRLVPPSHAQAYAEGLPDARAVVLPEVGHYPYAEAPEPFAAEVSRFLATLALG
jgi:pimeloyl-ACP methyl ester carboxylesterase